MRRIECCYECTKRGVGCHTTCEEYKAEKAKLDEETKVIKKRKDEYYGVFNNHKYDNFTKKLRRN